MAQIWQIDRNIQSLLIQELNKICLQGYKQILIHSKQNTHQVIDTIAKIAIGEISQVLHIFPDLESGDIILCYHTPQPLNTKPNQLDFASYLSHQGIGLALIDKPLSKVRMLGMPSLPKNKLALLDLSTVADPLRPGGTLSQLIKHYEVRDSQIEMLEFIAKNFNTDGIGIAEGGTGVGKSFAYLIPAIKWAMQNSQRVLISTATIALQQQLLKKDIPFVKKILNADIKAVLVKGRRNYLCLQHLQEVLSEEKLFLKEDDPLSIIEKWVESTKTGDKSELPFLPQEDLWTRISSDTDSCLGSKCPHYQNCFIFKARKSAHQAQVLIANHHLFFADLIVRSQIEDNQLSILPPYHKVIFDEAHQIESSATQFFSSTFSFHALQRLLSQLSRRRKNKQLGLLYMIKDALPQSHFHEKLLEKAFEIFDTCIQAGQKLSEEHAQIDMTSIRLSVNMKEEQRQKFIAPLHRLWQTLSNLYENLVKIKESLEHISEHTEMFNEFLLVLKRVKKLVEILEHFVRFEEYSGYVFWAERRRTRFQDQYFTYLMTPLDIGQMLQQFLYKRQITLLMTSATLTFNHQFDYFLQKMGLKETAISIKAESFPSPFNYEKQICFMIPSNLAAVEDEENFSRDSHALILSIIKKNPNRGMLILFTSYYSLKNCAEFLYTALAEKKIPLLKQGDEERAILIEKFVKAKNAILLGTDSFWEGVDISNDALKILIMMRLPFQPPNTPLLQAKQEIFERAGINPFLNLQVPEAAIKLKQGFGRLMRKSNDTGCILILDQRIVKKRYGEFFMKTLPHSYSHQVNCAQIPGMVFDFLEKNDG
ncbi:MAG: ATP-dependent DNA helicase [Spirochaetia bacterium]